MIFRRLKSLKSLIFQTLFRLSMSRFLDSKLLDETKSFIDNIKMLDAQLLNKLAELEGGSGAIIDISQRHVCNIHDTHL